MGTQRGQAMSATSGLFGWLKSIVKREKPQVVVAVPPGSPRANSRKVAAEEVQTPSVYPLDAKSSAPSLLPLPSQRRAQTWVTDGSAKDSIPANSASGADVVEDRLDSFNASECPTQHSARRFNLLSGPLGLLTSTDDEGCGRNKPSGGHTAVEVLDPIGTQDSFSVGPARAHKHHLESEMDLGAPGRPMQDARCVQSADNIPRTLRSCRSGLAEAGLCDPPGSPHRSGELSPRPSRPSSAVRNAQCPPCHSRSRLGGGLGGGFGSATDGSGTGVGSGGGPSAATTSTKTTSSTTTTTNNNNNTSTSSTTTKVVPDLSGGSNLETTKRTSLLKERTCRQVTMEREVEDTREEDPAGPPGTTAQAPGDGSARMRHRETQRRNESYSRQMDETRTEETCSQGQGHTGLAGAAASTAARRGSKTVTTTQRREEEEEEREVRETTTEDLVVNDSAYGRPAEMPLDCASRHSRTSHVSSHHTTWRKRTSCLSTTTTAAASKDAPAAAQPPPPPLQPTTAAWSAAPKKQAQAACAPPQVSGGGGGGYDGNGGLGGAAPVLLRDYQRQGTLTERDLVTLSGGHPYLGLESRTDILGRFLDDAGDGLAAQPATSGLKLHPPPMTPSCRSLASVAVPVRPYHETVGVRGGCGAGDDDDVAVATRTHGNGHSGGASAYRRDRSGYPTSRPALPMSSQQPSHTRHPPHVTFGTLSHQQQQQQQRQEQQQTSTSHHTVEVRSSTVTFGGERQQVVTRQQQSSSTHMTTTRTSRMMEGGGGPAGQHTREEVVQETHRHQHRAATTTTTTNSISGGVQEARDHGPRHAVAATASVLRQAAERLSGTGDGSECPGATGDSGRVGRDGGARSQRRVHQRSGNSAADNVVLEPGGGSGGSGNSDDGEERWDVTGGGRRTRRTRRVRIASAWRNGGGGKGAAAVVTDGEYAVDTSWDAYALPAGGTATGTATGGKSFVSRSGKSQSSRVSPPRTAGGHSQFGGGDANGEGDGYDKYISSSRALAAQAQLMRASKSRNAAAALTVLTSALNPLTWRSGISPSSGGGGGYGTYAGFGHGGYGAPTADGTELRAAAGGGGGGGAHNALQQPWPPAGASENPGSRRFQSSPGNADIPGLPPSLRHVRRDRRGEPGSSG